MTERHDYIATYNVTAPRAVARTSGWTASAQAIEEDDAVVARPLPEATQHVARASMTAETLSALIASQSQSQAPSSSGSGAASPAASHSPSDYDGFTPWADIWGTIRHELIDRVGRG